MMLTFLIHYFSGVKQHPAKSLKGHYPGLKERYQTLVQCSEEFYYHTIDKFKGGLTSESFSLLFKSPQKGTKNYPEKYPSKEKTLRIVICHLFWEILAKVKKLSEIKPPVTNHVLSRKFFINFRVVRTVFAGKTSIFLSNWSVDNN